MFKTIALIVPAVLVGFSSFATAKTRKPKLAPIQVQAPPSFYCIAFPSTHSVRVPALPGYGHGPVADSQQSALSECQTRSPFGGGANCRISACYPE